MARLTSQTTESSDPQPARQADSAAAGVLRIKSEDLLREQREVEIDHHGRIYRLRLTQLNKLILTA